MKRRISYAIIFALIGSVIALGATYADEEQDQRNALTQINSQINQSQKELKEGKKKEKELTNQIAALEGQIGSAEKEINALQSSIGETKKKITGVKQDLAVVEQEMNEQNENLEKRLRTMYMNGDASFLEILLGSESITDFMANMDLVQKIHENDVDVLMEMEEQHEKIAAKKKELENLEASLIAERQRETEKQQSLQANRGEVANLRQQVAEENQHIQEDLDQQKAAADAITSWLKSRQTTTAYEGSGKLGWPAPGVSRTTSEYGYRVHPILKTKKLHTGLDIGAPSGTKIVAAEKGTVIKAGWNNSYGYMVMVDHGGGIVTLYAHNSSLIVKEGDRVERGTPISYSGSTGMSTGPHLHFEVRNNGNYENPRSWL